MRHLECNEQVNKNAESIMATRNCKHKGLLYLSLFERQLNRLLYVSVLLFVVLFCVNQNAECHGTLAHAGPVYICPLLCVCTKSPNNPWAINVNCRTPFLGNNRTNVFSHIESNFTTELKVECSSPTALSTIRPYALSHLTELEVLVIIYCRFHLISR